MIRRRYGTPGFGKFAYLVDTLLNQYIVYASTFKDALTKYSQHHTYEPWSIRQMADNE